MCIITNDSFFTPMRRILCFGLGHEGIKLKKTEKLRRNNQEIKPSFKMERWDVG